MDQIKKQLIELAELVQEARKAQKKYFKDRLKSDLEYSKSKERELDVLVSEILNPKIDNQSSLF